MRLQIGGVVTTANTTIGVCVRMATDDLQSARHAGTARNLSDP